MSVANKTSILTSFTLPSYAPTPSGCEGWLITMNKLPLFWKTALGWIRATLTTWICSSYPSSLNIGLWDYDLKSSSRALLWDLTKASLHLRTCVCLLDFFFFAQICIPNSSCLKSNFLINHLNKNLHSRLCFSGSLRKTWATIFFICLGCIK